MRREEFERILEQAAGDGHLSRGEARALRDRLKDAGLSSATLRSFRDLVFERARQEADAPRARALFAWVEDVVDVLDKARAANERSRLGEVLHSPGDDIAGRLRALIDDARRTIDVCVYTITDDRLTNALIHAHKRGRDVRLLTDDAKARDAGSDVWKLRQDGVPVRTDGNVDELMHHKFALFDGIVLATGSYNWTVGADEQNYENLIVSDDDRLVDGFRAEFDRLWAACA